MRMPLSPFDIVGGLNHSRIWAVKVREKFWGKKEMTYILAGTTRLLTKQHVVDWCKKVTHAVEVLEIEPITDEKFNTMQRLERLPARHYQFGAIDDFMQMRARLLNPTVESDYKSLWKGHRVAKMLDECEVVRPDQIELKKFGTKSQAYVPLSQRSTLWRQPVQHH